MPATMETDATLSDRDCQMIHQLVVGVLELSGYCDWRQGPAVVPEEECLPTAPDLARHLNLKLDKMKKKLKWLLQTGLLEAVSYTPKRYRLDMYHMSRLAHQPSISFLFEPDSPYAIPALIDVVS